ncbi:hypothetical protein [Synechococcus sp. WH 6501]
MDQGQWASEELDFFFDCGSSAINNRQESLLKVRVLISTSSGGSDHDADSHAMKA